jgi:tetratricopeptide (TPR) repeat protein
MCNVNQSRSSAAKRQLPRLLRFYRDYLADHSGAAYVRSVAETYDISTLGRLCSADNRIVRRAAVLAIGMLGDMRVNHVLGTALQDDDRGVRVLADQLLRDIWLRDGNPQQQQKLRIAVRQNHNFEFDSAWRNASDLIGEAPSLAEAYHQRAIAFACWGEFDDAIADLQMTLELNPYHFAAAAAMAQAMLELNDHAAALECFERALKLNPNLEGVRARVQQLQRQLGQ